MAQIEKTKPDDLGVTITASAKTDKKVGFTNAMRHAFPDSKIAARWRAPGIFGTFPE